MVVRTGPQEYEIYDGTLTTCQLPNPDWTLSSGKIMVDMDNKKANAQHSIFHLMNMPVLYLPYVTHPVDSGGRQSGFLIPTPGYSSTKGIIFGEEYYWAINRSTGFDMMGSQCTSPLRGWEQSATRFAIVVWAIILRERTVSGLLGRGITTNGVYHEIRAARM